VRLEASCLPLLAALGGDLPPSRRLSGVGDAYDNGDEQQEAEAADNQHDHGDHLPRRCGRLIVVVAAVVDIIIDFLPHERTPATVIAVQQGPERA
jgi:hypothetical protein